MDAETMDGETPEPRPKTAQARHAASLIVFRAGDEPEMLMGMRGAKHRFMPNRLVFPGGRVDPADMSAACGAVLSERTEKLLRKSANQRLAYGLAICAARELREETGLTLGDPPDLDGIEYLARAVTPPAWPIRFNARFLMAPAERVSGEIGGDGELDNLRFYGMREALALDLALPTRRVLEQLQLWLATTEAERAEITKTPVMLRDRPWTWE